MKKLLTMALAIFTFALTSFSQEPTPKFPKKAIAFAGSGTFGKDATSFTGSVGYIYQVKGVLSVQPRISFTLADQNSLNFAVAPTITAWQWGKVATYVGAEFSKASNQSYIQTSPEVGALLLHNSKAFTSFRLNYDIRHNPNHNLGLTIGIGLNL
jgi:hypothetical protein